MLKKFLIGTFVALALMVTSTAFAAYDFGPTTLKVGSKGDYVKTLQQFVGASPVDGSFGPMTKAKVVAWQANNGLTADGMFGNMSKAKANDQGSNFPAGCTNASGFSSVTGLPCTTVVANSFAPAGCTSASGFSPVTGGACYAVSSNTLPAGCTSTMGFSSTTGMSCSTGTPSGPLAGGAGDITVTELSSPSSSTKVGEGNTDVKVLGIEVEADNGSDIAISSMRVTLEHAGTGNDKLDRYAKSVSIWMGSTKVGSANVSEFSESAGIYSKTINLSNAIVRADKTEKFYVAVDALADIDSNNTGSSANTWTTTLTSTRFMDATGVVLTDSTGSIANTHVYDTLSNTGDVELKVNLSSGTPASSTVKVSTTSDTNQVKLLEFTMKAQNSSMNVDQIPFLFESANETDLDQMTSNVTLVIDGQTFNESLTTAAASNATISFDDLDLNLDANETITGTIYADMNDIETSTFDEGSSIKVSLTSTLVTTTGSSAGALDVEDASFNQLVAGDRSGSAIGNTMTFRSEGVNAVMGTPTYSSVSNDSGQVTSVTYTIPVAVTSFGDTLYMGQSAQLATAASASNAFALVIETAAAPTTESVSATTSITLSTTNAVIESNGYRLDDGQTKNFTVQVTLLAATDNTSHRFRLDTIRTFTGAGLESTATATNSDLLPLENYRTGFQFINN